MNEIILSKSLQDYIETIYIIQQRKSCVRVSEIGKYLKVKMPSVNQALKELKKKNLVNYEKYSHITLTSSGEKIAEKILSKHNILKTLFSIVGIDEKNAEKYACELEHSFDNKSYSRLKKFITQFKKEEKCRK